MKPVTIRLEPPPPSPNVTLRLHWRKRAKAFDEIAWQVYYALLLVLKSKPKIMRAFGGKPVIISGTRFHKPGKALDPDNFIGSLKPVIDGLVGCSLIPDDTEQYVSLGEFRQRSFGGKPYLEMSIEQR